MSKKVVKRKVSAKSKVASKPKVKSQSKTKKVVKKSLVAKAKKEVLPPTANTVVFQLWKAKQGKAVDHKPGIPMPKEEKTFHGTQAMWNQNQARFNGPRRKAS